MSNIDTTIPVSEANVDGENLILQAPQTVDVLYDMRSEDESINLGYPNGVVGYTNLDIDFTPYSRVRIFASLNNCDCQREIDIVNRYRYDVAMHGFANDRKTFILLRVQVPQTLTKFQVVGYSIWTWSDTDATVTVTHDKTSEDIFVYRIEGIK